MSDGTPIERPPVRFFFIKANHFRVLHVDGAIGGLTPQGLIHMAVYSERPAIPQLAEHDIAPDGTFMTPRVEGKSGIVREIDADLMLSKDVAIHLRDWLDDRIRDLDRATSASPTLASGDKADV